MNEDLVMIMIYLGVTGGGLFFLKQSLDV